MIRREILLSNRMPCWLLISQIEHARLGRVLGEHCAAQFGPRSDELHQVRAQLLDAILHHDDGWAAWEAQPGLDPQLRRPLSFRELPLGEVLANWDGSIAAAAEIGPLAAWTVAGHFVALLENSAAEHDKAAATHWLTEIAAQRSDWLAAWRSRDLHLHTPALAEEALLWLQAFDLLSLWLCAVCPAGGETVACWPDDCTIAPGTSLEMVLHADRDSATEQSVTVRVDPWRFDVPNLRLEAAAHVVPQRPYRDAADLLSAYVPHPLRWQLAPARS